MSKDDHKKPLEEYGKRHNTKLLSLINSLGVLDSRAEFPLAKLEVYLSRVEREWKDNQMIIRDKDAALAEAVEALREIHDFLADVYCAHPDDATDLNKWMEKLKPILAKYQEGE